MIAHFPCHSEERSDEESCDDREGKILRCAQDDSIRCHSEERSDEES